MSKGTICTFYPPLGMFFSLGLRPVRFFWKKFLLSESCSNFLEWLAELGEISWKFLHSIPTLLLTHTCPACFVNPIPHRRHPSSGKLHATDERQLLQLHENHRCVLLRGTFFPQVAAQSAPGAQNFPWGYSENFFKSG